MSEMQNWQIAEKNSARVENVDTTTSDAVGQTTEPLMDGSSTAQKFIHEAFDYNQRLQSAFKAGDLDSNNTLTKEEISKALDSDAVADPDKKILETLKEHFKDVREAATDYEPPFVVTPFDLRIVARVSEELKQTNSMTDKTREYAQQNFSSIDTDGNGWLSKKELENFKAKSTDETAPIADFLIKHRSDITDVATGGHYYWRFLTGKEGIKRSDLDGMTLPNMTRAAENSIYKTVHTTGDMLLGVFRPLFYNYRDVLFLRDDNREGIRQFIDKTK